MTGENESRPESVLDPTPRSVYVLEREVSHVRELQERDKESYDQAIELLQTNADKSPSIAVVHQIVVGHKELVDQKIADLVKLIDQASIKDQKALDAALSAQKGSADKSELGIVKLLEKMEEKFATVTNNIAKDIADLKSRLDTGEGQDKGAVVREVRSDRMEDRGYQASNNTAAYIGTAVSMLIAIVAVAALALQAIKP